MKKYFILIVVLLLFSSIYALSGEKILDIYRNVERMSKIHTPNSYKVKVENESFNEALKELPEDILIGREKPQVLILFRKDEGVKIVIENIKGEYASLFSMYEDYFKFSGISKVQNPNEFKEIIDKDKISVYKEDKNSIIVKAWDPQKEEKDDDYALFYLDKKNWVIREAIYYLDGNPYVKAVNSYKTYGKYYMPYKIVLTNMNDNSSDVFHFMDYQFNK